MDKLRICRVCNETSDNKEFCWRVINKTRQNICKDCQKAKSKEHYNNNTDSYKTRNKGYSKDKRDFILNHLINNPCVDCGETNILCLEFDHVERVEKSFTIATYLGNNYKDLDKIKSEVDKCVVRCANCHRIKTAKENNNYRYRYLNNNNNLGKP